MIWTAEKKEQLRKLAAQGLSSTQIIKALGDETLTKNAIVGACHRYGAQLQGGKNRKKPVRTRPKKWESIPRHEKKEVEKIMARVIGGKATTVPPKATVVVAPPGEPRRIKITTGKLSYTPFSGFNTGSARCMWAGCKNMSIARGKPYCSFHMEKYRKAS